MKTSNKSPNGTSFHDTVFMCTVETLEKFLGPSHYGDNSGSDKVNYEWVCEIDSGDVFTIYDWKTYRPLTHTEQVEWHIGGHTRSITEKALGELHKLILEKQSS